MVIENIMYSKPKSARHGGGVFTPPLPKSYFALGWSGADCQGAHTRHTKFDPTDLREAMIMMATYYLRAIFSLN